MTQRTGGRATLDDAVDYVAQLIERIDSAS